MGAVSDEHDEGSIRTYPELKKDTAANGTQIYWLDACTETTNRRLETDKRWQNDFLFFIFIVASCILNIHLLSRTNKCTNYITYYLKSV
jgi:hypothetical protein